MTQDGDDQVHDFIPFLPTQYKAENITTTSSNAIFEVFRICRRLFHWILFHLAGDVTWPMMNCDNKNISWLAVRVSERDIVVMLIISWPKSPQSPAKWQNLLKSWHLTSLTPNDMTYDGGDRINNFIGFLDLQNLGINAKIISLAHFFRSYRWFYYTSAILDAILNFTLPARDPDCPPGFFITP